MEWFSYNFKWFRSLERKWKKARKTAEEAELIFLDKKWNGSYITFGARLWYSKQEASVYEETGNSIMFTPTHASAFYKLNENSRMGTTVDKDPENFYIQGTIKCTKGGNCIINNCGADEWEETSDVMIEEGRKSRKFWKGGKMVQTRCKE